MAFLATKAVGRKFSLELTARTSKRPKVSGASSQCRTVQTYIPGSSHVVWITGVRALGRDDDDVAALHGVLGAVDGRHVRTSLPPSVLGKTLSMLGVGAEDSNRLDPFYGIQHRVHVRACHETGAQHPHGGGAGLREISRRQTRGGPHAEITDMPFADKGQQVAVFHAEQEQQPPCHAVSPPGSPGSGSGESCHGALPSTACP